MLTPSQVEFYHKRGYLAVENVLTPAQLAEARRVTDDFVEQSRAVTAHNEIFDLEPDHTAARPQPPRTGSIFEIQTQLKEPVFAGR